MRKFISASLFLLPLLTMAGVREITFYEVRSAAQAPVLDGKLDDPCWKNAQVLSRYYQYGRPNPQLSPLRTEFRALYDAHGLYVAIVNHDDRIDMLRYGVCENDNIDLWRDDCAELYFDPEANGIGHTIFTVNAKAVKGDRRRLDTAVVLNDWSGYGWLASASIGKDRWTLELFFPWADLGKTAVAGDLWQFLHARYAWKPKFIGASSAAGADYRVTENFGYLFFAGQERVTPQKIAELLQQKVRPPCILSVGGALIRFTESETRIELAAQVLNTARTAYSQLLAEAKALHAGQLPAAAKLAAGCEKPDDGNPLAAYQQLTAASEELFKLKWEYFLKLNFDLPEGEK